MSDGSEKDWVSTEEAIRLSGFVNKTTWLRAIRARHIQPRLGGRNKKFYSRAKMLELARDREAAENRRANRDPLNDPLRSGEIHAMAAECFEQGATPLDVVRRLKITFDQAEDLYGRWCRLRNANSPRPAAPPVVAPTPDPFPLRVAPVEAAAPPARPTETTNVLEAARAAAEAARKAAGA